MSPAAILALFLVLTALELAWELFLTALNQRHVRRSSNVVPPFFRVLWSRRHAEPPEPRYATSVAYTLERSRLSVVARVVGTAVTVAVATSGLLGALAAAITAWIPGPVLAGVIYVLVLGLALRIVALPVAAWAHFGVERKFGFNRMGPGLWLADVARGLVISALIVGPLAAGLFVFLDRAGSLWWLWASLGLIAVQLGLGVIYPAVIAPLFNRFRPLEEGSLKTRTLELAKKLGFGVRGIWVMDASRRSRHSNAYFTGLGRAKRIVFYDTLLEKMGEEEILAVLAHEIGHDRLGHLWKGILFQAVATVAGFWLLSLLLAWTPLYRAFGLPSAWPPALLVIAAIASGPLTFVFQPLLSLWSRSNEYAADRYSHNALGRSTPLVNALFLLASDNLSNLTPHPLYSFYHYTHPTLAERLAALEKLDGARGLSPSAP